MKAAMRVINQIFELQHKINDMGATASFERNFSRLYDAFEEEGFIIKDPSGEIYEPSRTDCEANIVGELSAKMKITKTLKPVIYQKVDGSIQLVQKAVVLAEKTN